MAKCVFKGCKVETDFDRTMNYGSYCSDHEFQVEFDDFCKVKRT